MFDGWLREIIDKLYRVSHCPSYIVLSYNKRRGKFAVDRSLMSNAPLETRARQFFPPPNERGHSRERGEKHSPPPPPYYYLFLYVRVLHLCSVGRSSLLSPSFCRRKPTISFATVVNEISRRTDTITTNAI